MNRAFELPLTDQWYTLESPAYPGLSKKEDGVERWTCSKVKNDIPPNIPTSRVCVFRFVDQSHTKFLLAWDRKNPTNVHSHPTYFRAPIVQELTSDYSLRPISAYGPAIVAYAQYAASIKDPSRRGSWNLVRDAVQDIRSSYSPNGRFERPTNVKSYEDGCRILDMSFSNGHAVEPPDQKQLPAAEICESDILEYLRVSFKNPDRRRIERHTAVIISVEEQTWLEAIGQNRLGRPIEIELLPLDGIKGGWSSGGWWESHGLEEWTPQAATNAEACNFFELSGFISCVAQSLDADFL